MKSFRGYTLIELVVVAGILGIIGVISVALFLATIRGGGKSSALNSVRSNGDYAITQMERMIRNARGIVGTCQSGTGTIEIKNPDGGTTTFSKNAEGKIASNAGVLISNDVSLDGPLTIDCVSQSSKAPELVTIGFTLQKGTSSSRDFAEAYFSTTVQLRSF